MFNNNFYYILLRDESIRLITLGDQECIFPFREIRGAKSVTLFKLGYIHKTIPR